MPTLGLTMIVKNESGVILRCLQSVASWIDYWAIHDTGSTDGTPEIIKNFFKERNIPGELVHSEWKNFGHNRTLAYNSIRGKVDFTLLVDADFVLNVKDPGFKTRLVADGNNIRYEGAIDYRQNLLVRATLPWKYHGVTHEYINCPEAKTVVNFDGITFTHLADGGSRTDKFDRDIRLLEQGLRDEPANDRYMFYLGQSYKDSKQYEKAIEAYTKRSTLGKWAEEVYYSLYQIGMCKLILKKPFHEFAPDLLRAYFYRPTRLESLYNLVKYCRTVEESVLPNARDIGYRLGMMAVKTPYPSDMLFIEKCIHEYMFLDELAMCAYYSGNYEDSCIIGRRILDEKKFPDRDRQRLIDNHNWYLKGYKNKFGKDWSGEPVATINEPVKKSETVSKPSEIQFKTTGSERKIPVADVKPVFSKGDDAVAKTSNSSNLFATSGSERKIQTEDVKPVFSKGDNAVPKTTNPSNLFKTSGSERSVTTSSTNPVFQTSQTTNVSKSHKICILTPADDDSDEMYLMRNLRNMLYECIPGEMQLFMTKSAKEIPSDSLLFCLQSASSSVEHPSQMKMIVDVSDGIPVINSQPFSLLPPLSYNQHSSQKIIEREYIGFICNGDKHVHGFDTFLQVAKQLPQHKFLVMTDKLPTETPSNVKLHPITRNRSGFFRLCKLVIMADRKPVFNPVLFESCSESVPTVLGFSNVDGILAEMNRLLENKEQYEQAVNDTNRIFNNLKQVYNESVTSLAQLLNRV